LTSSLDAPAGLARGGGAADDVAADGDEGAREAEGLQGFISNVALAKGSDVEANGGIVDPGLAIFHVKMLIADGKVGGRKRFGLAPMADESSGSDVKGTLASFRKLLRGAEDGGKFRGDDPRLGADLVQFGGGQVVGQDLVEGGDAGEGTGERGARGSYVGGVDRDGDQGPKVGLDGLEPFERTGGAIRARRRYSNNETSAQHWGPSADGRGGSPKTGRL